MPTGPIGGTPCPFPALVAGPAGGLVARACPTRVHHRRFPRGAHHEAGRAPASQASPSFLISGCFSPRTERWFRVAGVAKVPVAGRAGHGEAVHSAGLEIRSLQKGRGFEREAAWTARRESLRLRHAERSRVDARCTGSQAVNGASLEIAPAGATWQLVSTRIRGFESLPVRSFLPSYRPRGWRGSV